MIVMSLLMLTIGFATYAIVGTQQAQSRVERERDSSFNLGESALYAEAFVLGRDWPTAANQYPPQCTQDDRGRDARVPDAERPSECAGQPGASRPVLGRPMDDQGARQRQPRHRDRLRLHARTSSPTTTRTATGSSGCAPTGWPRAADRSIVGLLQREELGESVAQNVITAGHFYTSNNRQQGDRGHAGELGHGLPGRRPLYPRPGRAAKPDSGVHRVRPRTRAQVSPDRVYSVPSTPNSMTPAQVDRFRGRGDRERDLLHRHARRSEPRPGEVVFVETSSTINCTVQRWRRTTRKTRPGW